VEGYKNYVDGATAIKTHLKHEWERLEERLDYLKGETKTYDNLEKLSKKYTALVITSSKQITAKQIIETTENVYVDNLFADLLEGYLDILIKLKEIKHANTLDYNLVFESIYSLIANIRARIKSIDKFIEIISNPITAINDKLIKDNRIEITVNSIKSLSEIKEDENEKSLKPYLFLRVLGYPTFCVGVIALLTAIVALISIFLDFYAQSRQIVYLQRESMELYNQALSELTNNFLLTLSTDFLFVLTINLAWICPVIALIYFITGRTVFLKLTNNNQLSSEQKYFLAFMHIDKGIFLFKHNLEKHKLLIIESAEEGNVNANIRLGDLYKKGKFEERTFTKPSKESLLQALKCYKRAFPDKNAVKKYEKLEKQTAVK